MRLEDYAILGDTHSVALRRRDGLDRLSLLATLRTIRAASSSASEYHVKLESDRRLHSRMLMRTSPILGMALLALALTACSGVQKTPLMTTSQNPAAQGQVETKRTDNKNTEVNLQVQHMAPPQKVVGDATVYVVWAQPLNPDAPPQNMGSLVIDKDRKGSLRTVTPHERFELLVTPEAKGTVDRPTNDPVMKAKISK